MGQHRDTPNRRQAARSSLIDRIRSDGPIEYPAALPITDWRDELVAAIAEHQVVVVAGETGSGKSTQLPKICLDAGRGIEGMIGHTQPRRVAARTIAQRVADELGTSLGDGVGYTIRFDDRVADQTVIRVMTDGILLNELQRDRDLSRYDTIIIDEAHERSLNIDFLLGYLRQLLARRPDLHLIITSATIDTDRFAAHFAQPDGTPAPVFVVEGRTYPVEIRYRPYGADNDDDPSDRRDQVAAVIDAVEELSSAGPGDILVFLSGEREIHDTADALRRRRSQLRGEIEVVPLYARLSAAEQHRIFAPHRGRRVIVSTNIAETSITVPGVRYVIDAGTARISRYSKRLKVQRLPIEPVSQASADQRAGRCGRVAPGICIRLYSADDYAARDEFTEPEILRTNLASVILQMTSIGLGDVAAFPFVEAPDSASIRDGYLLLDELGALAPGRTGSPRRLTPIGRKIARLPIDPRLGRMVIEADRQGSVKEVLVIASALSIQDVRERPRDQPERAAEFHRRFAVEGSDLMTVVEVWNYLQQRQKELSGNAFRRMCRDEYFHYLRVREWRDLYSQLRRIAGQIGIRPGGASAHPDHVHRAVMAGLLSHLGRRDEGRDYKGARDARFVISRGSAVAKQQPEWVMAAELVETNQLWAHRVAAIQPEWAEDLADHLTKRSYGDPWWDPDEGRAKIAETVTLYGLPIVSRRTIGLDRVDKRLARELFIRFALVDGDLGDRIRRPDVMERNARFAERVGLLEARVRRSDLLDDAAVYEFYDQRLPRRITSMVAFNRWWRDARADTPELLDFTPALLVGREGITLADYPDSWGPYPITYRFDPGTPLDGATVTIPVAGISQVDTTGWDWSIPGYRRELVDELVRSLPKAIRRDLIPMADTVDAALAHIAKTAAPGEGSFYGVLAEALTAVSGRPIAADDLDPDRLSTHLRLHIVVVGPDGEVIDAGDDLAALQERGAPRSRRALADTAPVTERQHLTSWDLGTLDRAVEVAGGTGQPVVAYPTLVDRGDSVSLRVVDNQDLQERAMVGGVRRLLILTAGPPPTRIRRSLDSAGSLAIAASDVDLDELVDESIWAAVDAIRSRYVIPWDEAAFEQIADAVRADADDLAGDALAVSADILAASRRVTARLDALVADAAAPTVADARTHLARLIAPGFVRRSGLDRLPDLHRYVRGIEYRLDHLRGDLARDRMRLAEVRPIEREVTAAVQSADRLTPELVTIVWMVEELRMSVFAQPVGVTGPVSVQRIRRLLRSAGF